MSSKYESLSDALRRMPVPPPRRGFVDDVLSNAVRASAKVEAVRSSRSVVTRWETWVGAAAGAAVAVVATVLIAWPRAGQEPAAAITMAVDEAKHIDVVIDSERTLEDATIRVETRGAVELDGFDTGREVTWQARVDRGRNVLSLPVVGRTEGTAQLVAVVEHRGRSRRVAVHLLVKPRLRQGVA